MATMIDLSNAAQLMETLEKEYFRISHRPYDNLGISLIYNESMDENQRVIKRIGCVRGMPLQMEGFVERGLHFCIPGARDAIADDVCKAFTVDGKEPLQWQIDITHKGVAEQFIYLLDNGITTDGDFYTPTLDSDKWYLARPNVQPALVDFSNLEDEMLRFTRDDGSKSTISLSAEQVENLLGTMKFWVKVKKQFTSYKMTDWRGMIVTVKSTGRHFMVISNNGIEKPFIDMAGTIDPKLGADMLFLKSNMITLCAALIRDYLEVKKTW